MLMEAGLSDNEAVTYLALLSLGTTTVGPVVKESKQPWSTCYNSLERLVEKGFAGYKIVSNKRYFTAVGPRRFRKLLQERVNVFDKLLPNLLKIEERGEKKEDVSIFVGYGGMRTIYEKLLGTAKKGDEHLFVGVGAVGDPKVLSFFKKWDKKRIERGIGGRFVLSEHGKEYIDQTKDLPNTKMRRVPIGYDAGCLGIDVVGDVSVVSLWTEPPYFIFIDGEKFAQGFRVFFETFWKISKPVK